MANGYVCRNVLAKYKALRTSELGYLGGQTFGFTLKKLSIFRYGRSIGLKFQKIIDFLLSTGVLYGWGGGWSLPDLKYLEANLKYLG